MALCVRIEPANPQLWAAFSPMPEMIVTNPGRALFPRIDVKIENLHPDCYYKIQMELKRVDGKKYTFENGVWKDVGDGSAVPSDEQIVELQGGAIKKGSHWMEKDVSFDNIKITNKELKKSDKHIFVHSMHKYVPVITVLRVDTDQTKTIWEPSSYPVQQKLDIMEFMVVTAYQCDGVNDLKKQKNKYAFGKKRANSDDSETSPNSSKRNSTGSSTCSGSSSSSPTAPVTPTTPTQTSFGQMPMPAWNFYGYGYNYPYSNMFWPGNGQHFPQNFNAFNPRIIYSRTLATTVMRAFLVVLLTVSAVVVGQLFSGKHKATIENDLNLYDNDEHIIQTNVSIPDVVINKFFPLDPGDIQQTLINHVNVAADEFKILLANDKAKAESFVVQLPTVKVKNPSKIHSKRDAEPSIDMAATVELYRQTLDFLDKYDVDLIVD
ncbi:unnamed protein product [Caenorhabditis sp. 36 PRJEB53466]|nr:unnamed protein product [Caenorhabditis sp. 36 PRJEB53466]